MPQYVVRSVHTSDQCPASNSKIRNLVVSGAATIPQLAEKLGVKILIGPLVLASEHEGITVVEAANVEAVGQFVLQSGMAQWNSVRVTASQTQQDALQELSSMPPPIY